MPPFTRDTLFVERKGAALGVLVSLENPRKTCSPKRPRPGVYRSPVGNGTIQNCKSSTIADLFNGAQVQMPPWNITFKQAERAKAEPKGQTGLFRGRNKEDPFPILKQQFGDRLVALVHGSEATSGADRNFLPFHAITPAATNSRAFSSEVSMGTIRPIGLPRSVIITVSPALTCCMVRLN